MREIKFRAWNPETKTMVYELEEINLLGTNIVAGISSGLIKASYMNGRGLWIEAELMQYTGLKDRNGREIYEGDIVISTNRLHECEVEENVHFLNGCFMFGNWNTHEFFNRHQSIKVIGNVYENPELLEEQHV
jgi:hypothetical protein